MIKTKNRKPATLKDMQKRRETGKKVVTKKKENNIDSAREGKTNQGGE